MNQGNTQQALDCFHYVIHQLNSEDPLYLEAELALEHLMALKYAREVEHVINVENTNLPADVIQETTADIAPTISPIYVLANEAFHPQSDRDESDIPHENLTHWLETEIYQYHEELSFEEYLYDDETDFIEDDFQQNHRTLEKKKNKQWDFGYLTIQ